MFVTALAAVFAMAPICKAAQARIEECEGTLEELKKDLHACKDANDRLAMQVALCKARRKVVKKKAPVVVEKEVAKPCCASPISIVNNVNVGGSSAEEVSLWKRERPSWLLGLRGAGGMAFCTPAGIGLVGIRANYLPLHLGIDVHTQFANGTVGAQLLAYPIQSKMAMWHINGGMIVFNQRPFLLPNLPRQVDLTLGTGVEVRVLPFMWVTADLQVRMPNPVAVSQTGQQFENVLTKSLVQTQGLLGLMLRTW